MCIVKRHTPNPVYEADQIFEQNGHEALRLPPYHCDLNAIELMWSLAKRKEASFKNIGLTSEELEKLINDSFESITSEEWKKMIDYVKHAENKYKERDDITEKNLESFIINVGNGDDSGSDESFRMEVLESDFDYNSELTFIFIVNYFLYNFK